MMELHDSENSTLNDSTLIDNDFSNSEFRFDANGTKVINSTRTEKNFSKQSAELSFRRRIEEYLDTKQLENSLTDFDGYFDD